jgi:hypothetical protein
MVIVTKSLKSVKLDSMPVRAIRKNGFWVIQL